MSDHLISGNVAATTALFAAVGVAATSKKYIEQLFLAARASPRGLTCSFMLTAWYFSYNLVCLTVAWENASMLEIFYRASFVFGGITMLLGPFLVVTPTNPIVLKKETFVKRMVRQAQKEETRRVTFVIFCLLTALQGFVVFSIYDVAFRILGMQLAMVIIICIFYALVSIFYLVVFYSVMMKKDVVVGGINLLDTIRRNLIFRTDTREFDVLAHKYYAKMYLGTFSFFFLAALACVIVLFARDISSASTSEATAAVISFIVHLTVLAAFAVFVMNVAFHPIDMTTHIEIDGKVVDVNKIKWTGIFRAQDALCLTDLTSPQQPTGQVALIREEAYHHARTAVRFDKYQESATVSTFAKLHQSNALGCMFYTATGIDYDHELAMYFLWFIQREVHPLLVDPQVTSQYGPLNLNALIRDAVSSTASRFSNGDLEGLTKEAKTHCRIWKQLLNEDDASVSTIEGALPRAVEHVAATSRLLGNLELEYEEGALAPEPLLDSTRGNLLQNIRQGTTLKKVAEPSTTAARSGPSTELAPVSLDSVLNMIHRARRTIVDEQSDGASDWDDIAAAGQLNEKHEEEATLLDEKHEEEATLLEQPAVTQSNIQAHHLFDDLELLQSNIEMEQSPHEQLVVAGVEEIVAAGPASRDKRRTRHDRLAGRTEVHSRQEPAIDTNSLDIVDTVAAHPASRARREQPREERAIPLIPPRVKREQAEDQLFEHKTADIELRRPAANNGSPFGMVIDVDEGDDMVPASNAAAESELFFEAAPASEGLALNDRVNFSSPAAWSSADSTIDAFASTEEAKAPSRPAPAAQAQTTLPAIGAAQAQRSASIQRKSSPPASPAGQAPPPPPTGFASAPPPPAPMAFPAPRNIAPVVSSDFAPSPPPIGFMIPAPPTPLAPPAPPAPGAASYPPPIGFMFSQTTTQPSGFGPLSQSLQTQQLPRPKPSRQILGGQFIVANPGSRVDVFDGEQGILMVDSSSDERGLLHGTKPAAMVHGMTNAFECSVIPAVEDGHAPALLVGWASQDFLDEISLEAEPVDANVARCLITRTVAGGWLPSGLQSPVFYARGGCIRQMGLSQPFGDAPVCQELTRKFNVGAALTYVRGNPSSALAGSELRCYFQLTVDNVLVDVFAMPSDRLLYPFVMVLPKLSDEHAGTTLVLRTSHSGSMRLAGAVDSAVRFPGVLAPTTAAPLINRRKLVEDTQTQSIAKCNECYALLRRQLPEECMQLTVLAGLAAQLSTQQLRGLTAVTLLQRLAFKSQLQASLSEAVTIQARNESIVKMHQCHKWSRNLTQGKQLHEKIPASWLVVWAFNWCIQPTTAAAFRSANNVLRQITRSLSEQMTGTDEHLLRTFQTYLVEMVRVLAALNDGRWTADSEEGAAMKNEQQYIDVLVSYC